MRHGQSRFAKMSKSNESGRHQKRSSTEHKSTSAYSMSSHARGISYIVRSEEEETKMMIESSSKKG